jgi:hypothetical protein
VLCYEGYQTRALVMWTARTGSERALDLAGKLTRFMLKPKLWGGLCDAELCSAKERGHVDSHFHARAIELRGILEYGLVARDWEAYEYMRPIGIFPRSTFAQPLCSRGRGSQCSAALYTEPA